MTLTTLSPIDLEHHPLFPAYVAKAAARAHEKLPTVNGRIERATEIVLAGGIELLPDGSALVRSQTEPDAAYLVNGTCSCDDAQSQAPDGWCKHRLAVALARRTSQAMAGLPAIPEYRAVASGQWAVARADSPLPTGHKPRATTHYPLPEAPASVNVRVLLHGRDCQITLCDTDEVRLLARLEALLARMPESPPPAPSATPGEGWCAGHGVQMRRNETDGHSCWSHKTQGGQWCKGK